MLLPRQNRFKNRPRSRPLRVLILLATFAAFPRMSWSAEPPSAQPFVPVDGWGWGGQALITPRLVLLSSQPPAILHLSSPPSDALYGELPPAIIPVFPPPHSAASPSTHPPVAASSPNCVILTGARTPHPLLRFTATNGDVGTNGAALKVGAVPWPICQGRPSAWITLQVRDPAGATPAVSRAAVWLGDAPGTLFYAFSGFRKGTITLDGKRHAAFLVDGNGDGSFGSRMENQLWIDRNDDGRLDVASEEFPAAPILKIEGLVYNLVIGHGGSSLALRPVTRPMSSARLTLDTGAHPVVDAVSASLVSRLGDVVSVSNPGQSVPLPAGDYCMGSLQIDLSTKDQPSWTYSFVQSGDALRQRLYPLKVTGASEAVLAPLSHLTLDATVGGDKRPGGTLTVDLNAHTDANLELTRAVQPGGDSTMDRDRYADITLLDSGGRVLDAASSGFA